MKHIEIPQDVLKSFAPANFSNGTYETFLAAQNDPAIRAQISATIEICTSVHCEMTDAQVQTYRKAEQDLTQTIKSFATKAGLMDHQAEIIANAMPWQAYNEGFTIHTFDRNHYGDANVILDRLKTLENTSLRIFDKNPDLENIFLPGDPSPSLVNLTGELGGISASLLYASKHGMRSNLKDAKSFIDTALKEIEKPDFGKEHPTVNVAETQKFLRETKTELEALTPELTALSHHADRAGVDKGLTPPVKKTSAER